MEPQTIQMPKLHMRADVRTGSYNPETRVFEVVFASAAPVTRYGWDGPFHEVLSMDPAHIRMDRIKSGRAPILDSHLSDQLARQIGVIEGGKIEGGLGIATARLSARESIAEIRDDVSDKIITNVSVGYRVHRWEQQEGGDSTIPVMLATDWEPYEVSLVPVPADGSSHVRKAEHQEVNPCIVVRRGGAQVIEERKVQPMEPQTQPNPAGVTPAAAAQPTPEQVRAIEQAAEQREISRGIAIRAIGQKAKMTDAEITKFITDKTSVEEVRRIAFDKMATASEEIQTTAARGVIVSDDRERRQDAISNMLMHRLDPANVELSKDGKDFRGMSLMDIARENLEREGVAVRGMSRFALATRALHTTSDFPIILGNVANRRLRDSYDQAKQTFRPFVTEVNLTDFKPVTMAQLGEAPQLLEVKEGAEFTRGTMGEAKEVYALKTHGRVVSMSRQMLINDDLNAFGRLARAFGLQCANLESDLVWNIIINNALMGDGKALFHADHKNLLTGATASALSEDGLDNARQLVRSQVGFDGVTPLSYEPTHLITGTKLETKAQKLMATVQSTNSGEVNVFANSLSRVVETRLDRLPATNWFLAAAGQGDMIDLAYLDGERGPQTETRVGFDVDGVDYKVRFDVNAKAIESKWIVKATGVN